MTEICLGIESTAHTLGIGIVENGKILSNARDMYRSPAGEGIIPRKAADHHADVFDSVLQQSLQQAGVSLRDIDLFAFSRGPGIGQCLRVSCTGAKFLAGKYDKPILGVNHCHAHLEVSRGLLGFTDPLYVYVSGANTQLITENKKSEKGQLSTPRFLVLGETLDMGLGNLFDVFAREAKIHPAHGGEVARLAEKGKYFPLPYTVKGMNFAFAGLLTSAVRAVGKHSNEDICHSLMETSFAELCEAAERALCLFSKKEVTVCGGVAQNKRFCEMLDEVCKGQGAKFGVAAPEFNADNGAMIAYTALSEWKKGKREKMDDLKPDGYWRIDQVN
ncbi:MAG: tRNA (adenosine(37)-N6)-threonylcarbamoyltransferase complex transferase subunit TsaD [Candidatus Micrarchaeota archaeon]|nr:tRNA (adenosine(37)-N6)-threonylcarbamoyltransferase complex transferase subunit TsaD [Candidatus Micrarchaeota archaeon]